MSEISTLYARTFAKYNIRNSPITMILNEYRGGSKKQ